MEDVSERLPSRTTEPSAEQLSEGIARLLDEVDSAFASDRWALLDSSSERHQWLFYDAAALRHSCQLLREMEVAAQGKQELSVRLLGRAHVEAWLVALYIHFGQYEAVLRIARDARRNLETFEQEANTFDERLRTMKKAARRRGRKITENNDRISAWNSRNPEDPPKALTGVPYVPQLKTTNIDLSDVLAGFGNQQPQDLSVSEIVDWLTKNASRLGFGRESFTPIYLIYRLLSTIGGHTTKPLLDGYFEPPSGAFIRIAAAPTNGSIIDSIRITSLYATAFIASKVLGSRGSSTTAADGIEAWLKPDPTGRAAWSPGI